MKKFEELPELMGYQIYDKDTGENVTDDILNPSILPNGALTNECAVLEKGKYIVKTSDGQLYRW